MIDEGQASLIMSSGNPAIFLTRPIAALLIVLCAVFAVVIARPRRRDRATPAVPAARPPVEETP